MNDFWDDLESGFEQIIDHESGAGIQCTVSPQESGAADVEDLSLMVLNEGYAVDEDGALGPEENHTVVGLMVLNEVTAALPGGRSIARGDQVIISSAQSDEYAGTWDVESALRVQGNAVEVSLTDPRTREEGG